MDELSALDLIAVLLALGGILGCVQFPFFVAPRFMRIYQDFGSALPALTLLAFRPWFGLAAALPAALSLGVAALPGLMRWVRRALIVASFFLALLGAGLCLAALYLPIFELAGKVQP